MITVSGIAVTSTHLSGNDIMVKLTTDSYPLNGMDYKLLLKITSPEGELDGAPFVPAIPPNASAEATFNISGYVDQRFERNIMWPIKGRYEGKLMGWINGSYTVWLYPGESWIDTVTGQLVENFQTPFQPIFIIKGRMPEIMLAQLNDNNITWFDHYAVGGRFLSFMPLTKLVTPHEPVKLWWIPPATLNGVNIYLRYYINGVGTTVTLLTGAMWMDILWEIECHPLNAGAPLADEFGNPLEKYEVWIENDGIAVTETRTFVIDWTPPHTDFYYLFVDNRMGGIETVGLTGRKIYKPMGERVLSKRPFIQGSGVQVPTLLPVSTQRSRKWTINSGWKPKEELEALDFLLDAHHAWLALPNATGDKLIANYKLCPVIITSSELILNDDTNEIESIDIDLEEAC